MRAAFGKSAAGGADRRETDDISAAGGIAGVGGIYAADGITLAEDIDGITVAEGIYAADVITEAGCVAGAPDCDYTENDTIVALATTPAAAAENAGAIAIIRLSGPGAFSIAGGIFRGKKPFDAIKPYTAGYGFIYERDTPAIVVIDEVLIIKMRAPKSYTREDVVEIHCHAGAGIQNRILRLILSKGARVAEPGEFTKRAFINGRLDLSQAEAVMDLIRAKSEAGAAMAIRQLEGALSGKLGAARETLIGIIASLEALLDFPEHEIEEQSVSYTDGALCKLERELCALADSFEYGRAAREGITAVIAGRPNVGKSTLLNLFAGKERAIVTEIPGTTRDIIDEYKDIGGFTVRFLDTAGIRETDDAVERIGVARTIGALEQADLAILLFGADEKFVEGDARLLSLAEGLKRVLVINKTDLAEPEAVNDIRAEVMNRACAAGSLPVKSGAFAEASEDNDFRVVEASLINGTGFAEIESAIRILFSGRMPPDYGDAILSNTRHYALTTRSIEAIRAAREALAAGLPLEMPIIDMREALSALGEITGETYSEDIIDRIFSEFCVGK